MADRIVPLILAGGAGTRLWPLSRSMMPKQFITLVGDGSTYQHALRRVCDRSLFEPPVVITHAEFQSVAVKQAREVGTEITAVLEPDRRDSCAAIAAGAVLAGLADPATAVLALPADHLISDDAPFLEALGKGLPGAADGHIVSFGITPTEPRTSFGYLRPGAALGDGIAVVAQFVEKPDAATAARLIGEGLLWNAGIFLFRADVLVGEVKRFQAGIHDAVTASVKGARRTNGIVHLDAEAFRAANALSIDDAVMEKTDKAAVVPATFELVDIGSWEAVLQACGPDGQGNHMAGDVELLETTGSYVRSEGRLTTVVGLNDVVVVATPDAVLVASRGSVQGVKNLVARLEARHGHLLREHVHSHRPWGWYQDLDRGSRFRVRRIVVEPGGRLSLQKHVHRAEHWIVVRGTAEVTLGEDVRLVHENESIYIPIGNTHRLANPGRIPLELIEVQTGSYLEEDDIHRLKDVYDRR